jgi:O-antigen/teichoic acid export membrane protein
VSLLYDARYHEAGWIVQYLACGAWFFALEATNGAALLACDRAQWVAFSNGAKLVGMIVMIPIGFAFWGFPGAVACYAGSDVFKWIVSCVGISRLNLAAWPRDIVYTLWTAGASCAGAWAATRVGEVHGSRVLPAIVVFVVVSLVWLPLVMRENSRLTGRGSA